MFTPRSIQFSLPLLSCLLALVNPAQASAAGEDHLEFAPKVIHPTRYNVGIPTRIDATSKGGKPTPTSNGIFYNGGPVMLGTTNIYYIWYGNWTGNSAQSILNHFAQNIGGSSYFNINTTYTDGKKNAVSNSVAFGGGSQDYYSHGTALSDADIQEIVTQAIQYTYLPRDPNGVYFVLTSADVTATSGFCSNYCGWHSHGTITGIDVKYSFVGNADRCPTACSIQGTSPNGNAGADAMASIIAHELEEAVTDPDLNAWMDKRGYENADKCAWTFGSTSTASNGSKYNLVLNGVQFLIQQNWVNASGGYCAMSF